MNKKVSQVASSSGSPMAVQNDKPAETKEYGAGFATSADGRASLVLLKLAHELVLELCELCSDPLHQQQKSEIEGWIELLSHPPKSANVRVSDR